jgi:hypothetical protein
MSINYNNRPRVGVADGTKNLPNKFMVGPGRLEPLTKT